LFGSLYTIAFVAALRKVPLFPRLLAAIWLPYLLLSRRVNVTYRSRIPA
jgi:hypothetical protein